MLLVQLPLSLFDTDRGLGLAQLGGCQGLRYWVRWGHHSPRVVVKVVLNVRKVVLAQREDRISQLIKRTVIVQLLALHV